MSAPRAVEDTQASAHAAARLRTMISDGALCPGAKLSEQTVAGELGVSRNTLRESFTTLAAEGLVDRIPHRGVFVMDPGTEDVRDLYAARGILETGAVLWGELDEALLARLQDTVSEALAARDSGNVAGMGNANQRFHRELVTGCGSTSLLTEMDRILARMRLVFHLMTEDPQFHARYAVRNAEVLDVLQTGDRERAASLLRESLVAAQEELLAHVG
ncbi:GntR family transcriptional regulator [Kocuria tytonicola]|uniref:GntR family transcriptional regulator n=1 Tax=Kocuria tytonicola TaxID=2055946 RepID=UPI001F0BAC90|nr:GntR family transcriptional regulator [Kocuria tytonicola]